MIEALTSHTPQKAFTDRIGSRRVVGRFQDLDATGCGHAREIRSKRAIIITDELLRSRAISGSLPQLLRCPCVGGESCDADVDHFP